MREANTLDQALHDRLAYEALAREVDTVGDVQRLRDTCKMLAMQALVTQKAQIRWAVREASANLGSAWCPEDWEGRARAMEPEAPPY